MLLAIIGVIGEPTGSDVVIPEVGIASLGYAVQVRVDGLPEVLRVKVMVDPTKRDTLLGGAVFPGAMVNGVEKKPPTMMGEGGTWSPSPDDGTDPGMGRSNAKGPTATEKGWTLPLVSRLGVSEPLIVVFPSARQADTNDGGSVSCIWYSDTANGSALGLGGARLPVVTTSLSTTLPTGVPGQYSSYGGVSAKAGVVELSIRTARSMVIPRVRDTVPTSASRTAMA